MASDTSNTRHRYDEYPSEDEIKGYREDNKKCSNPYTLEDMKNMEFDGEPPDFLRLNARIAIDILTEYGISFEEEHHNDSKV